MEISDVVRNENWEVSFKITADQKEYFPFLNAASLKLQHNKPLEGYRQGKAPLALVKARYGDALFQTANEHAINTFFAKACKNNGFQPVSEPVVLVLKNDLDGLIMNCMFYDYPRLTDLHYMGLQVEKPIKTCSEADIDREIDHYMRNHLYVHEVEREARMGDIIEVSFSARTIDGEHFDYDHSSKLRYALGTDTLFTGLDVLLEGHEKGEVVEATLTLPEDFHRAESAGLTIVAKVTIRGVWQRDMLPCTDAYVKEHVRGCDTVADLREKYRRNLQKLYDDTSRRLFERNLRSEIAAQVTCYIPEAMVDVPMRELERGFKQIAAGKGITVEKLLEGEGKTLEQVLKENRSACEEDVKLSVALDYVAKKENLKVSEKELNRRLTRYAKKQGIELSELEKKENFLNYQEMACEELLNEKALQVIQNHLSVTEREYETLPEPF